MLSVSVVTQSIVYSDQMSPSNEINIDTTIINRRDLPSNIPLEQAIINSNKEKNANWITIAYLKASPLFQDI